MLNSMWHIGVLAMPKISAVIVAGGSSSRMRGTDKIFLNIGGKTVLERSVGAFEKNALVNEIVVVTNEGVLEQTRTFLARCGKLKDIVIGGDCRNASVQNGVAACSRDSDYYAIHDAARPFVTEELITCTLRAAMEYGAAAPGLPLTDTIKEVDGENRTLSTPDRSRLVAIATPQVFAADLYRAAARTDVDVFDDCQLLENAGHKVKIVDGDPNNIKITTQDDISRAGYIAGYCEMRIGHGYDVHRLVGGRKLILAGVEIEHHLGLLGHSDADVLTHAIIDAVLGAAALGDIGKHFPDTDGSYKDADSLELFSKVIEMISSKGYAIGNIDATVICQKPRLRPHIERMRENIARVAKVGVGAVNIKATTEEGLGFSGEERGIAAHAVVTLSQSR